MLTVDKLKGDGKGGDVVLAIEQLHKYLSAMEEAKTLIIVLPKNEADKIREQVRSISLDTEIALTKQAIEELERSQRLKHLKLLPQFIDKVADGTKTLHIKKRPLPLGVYEIVNGETGEPTGLKVEVVTVAKGNKLSEPTWELAIDNMLSQFRCEAFGFDTETKAEEFYRNYLVDAPESYMHYLKIMPEANQCGADEGLYCDRNAK